MMSRKRRNTSSPECESPEQSSPGLKHQNDLSDDYDSDENDSREQPQINAATGQTGAFPGLRDSGELFYGPANDGLDYLRMVRSEAQDIPQLLKAQSDDQYGPDESGFWDDDGTYVAKPLSRSRIASNGTSQTQEKYSAALLNRFRATHALLQHVPPLSAIEKLKSSQPISFPLDNKNARQKWEAVLINEDPSPTQVACMDQDSIFQLLRLIEGKMQSLFTSHNEQTVDRIGAWVWSTLAKCPEKGQLDPEQISSLRKLAQQAIETSDSLNRPANHEATVEDGANTNTLTADIEAARKRLSNDTVKSMNQDTRLVILDMIILVVGEEYGQRDLLEKRNAWRGACQHNE